MSSETKECMKERLHRLEQDLKENQAFLQTYMLSPSPDFRPAEEERIRQISRLADEMMEILTELAGRSEDNGEADFAGGGNCPCRRKNNFFFDGRDAEDFEQVLAVVFIPDETGAGGKNRRCLGRQCGP